MVQESGKARYSVTLSREIIDQVKEQAMAENAPISAVLAEIVGEHYSRTAASDCVDKLDFLQRQYKDLQHQAETEIDALTRRIEQESEQATQSVALQAGQIKELQDELDAAKTRLTSLQQDAAYRDDTIRSLEQEKQTILTQTEEELAAKDEDIRKLEEGVPELLRRLEEEKASKETVTTGLQHELERSRDKAKTLEQWIADLKGQIQDLKEDKQHLQKQLELVTLRLPAPKEGILSRIFSRKKKED